MGHVRTRASGSVGILLVVDGGGFVVAHDFGALIEYHVLVRVEDAIVPLGFHGVLGADGRSYGVDGCELHTGELSSE